MGPFVSGVYAGDPKMIGARASFNKFWSFENDYGSMIIGSYFYMRAKKKRLKAQGEYIRKGLHSFKGGLGALTSRLSEELADDIVSGIELQDIRKEGSAWKLKGGTWSGSAKSIIFAMPPHKLAPVIESIDVETSNHLSKIPMAPVLVAHWSYPAEEERVPPGFGFLMPRIFDLKVLGTLFPSHLFPDRTPNGHNLLASFYGGMLEPDTMKLNDEEFIQLVKREHEIILGTNSERMRILKVMRYPNAIPQLLPGHPENIDTIRMLLSRTPGIILAGNYLTGVGMEHAVHSGFTAFENCMRFLSGPKGI